MNFLYIDCFSGISGDMFLAALIGLGYPLEELKTVISQLNLDLQVESEQVVIKGIQARTLKVTDPSPRFRGLKDIGQVLDSASLPTEIATTSFKVFKLLAEAEATVHGISPEQVHFHEIGAADTLVDIVGVLSAITYLQTDKIYSASIPWSTGFIDMSHGRYPAPAPATALLLQGLPCSFIKLDMELVTPTGAALMKGLSPYFESLPAFRPERIAYGAGSKIRPDSVPNLLRLVKAQTVDDPVFTEDSVVVVETQMDDITPEHAAFLFELLNSEPSVVDVYTTTVVMKKGRTGILFTILVKPETWPDIASSLVHNSSTIGLRYSLQRRLILNRTSSSVNSPWGPISIKVVQLPDGTLRAKPEFDDCRKIALEQNMPISQIFQFAMEHWACHVVE